MCEAANFSQYLHENNMINVEIYTDKCCWSCILYANKHTHYVNSKESPNNIEKHDSTLHAFVTKTPDYALSLAKKLDEKINENIPLSKLDGATMGVKDIFLTKDIKTTSSSKVLENFVPPYSSTVFENLQREGAIMVGKTNTDTFAFGASTENSGYGPSKNPWNPALVPGGSSGGSAVSQAAEFATFNTGTDTGGSIRQPASLCGVSGIKPTYGRNSRYGIAAMASSFDCPGVFANTVEDLALLTEVTAGLDPQDATSSPVNVPEYSKELNNINLKGLKIGLPKEYFSDPLDLETKQKIQETVKWYESQGAIIKEVSLPSSNLGIAVYYILVPSEISANMARYDGLRFGNSKKDIKDLWEYYQTTRGEFMEPEIKRRIMIGTYVLSAGYFDAYYTKASKVRTLIINEFKKVLTEVDVLLAPVSPTPAWPLGQKANDPLAMYLADIYTVCVNVAGLPSLALPCGFNNQGLPLGFQLIGNYFEESKLFSIGHQYQQATNFHLQEPKL